VQNLLLPLSDPQTPLLEARCVGYARFIERLASADGDGNDNAAAVVDVRGDAAAELSRSAEAAGLTDGEIRYVPSQAARERVGGEADGGWPQSVATRHRKAIRRTRGALLSFPPESADSAEAAIEVFTTDWSPTPAACAIAVHPGHPSSTGLPDGTDFAFTGRYCRHPLTGDLLPIWTAAWVKPEFGTGAVLVNPGHDAADLAFARKVGLPVRFALVPEDHDESGRDWVTPPVVKTGRAIRTGVADGLDYTAAQAEYFRILSSRGLAREYTDFGTGTFRLASAVLAAVDPALRGAKLTVVAPSSAIESDLLALRLLLAEPGFDPAPAKAPEVVLVGAVTGKSDGIAQDVLELALLTGAAVHEVVALKPQQFETAQRFLEAHADLAAASVEPGEADPATLKAAGQVGEFLRKRDVKQAFGQLYRLQKTLLKSEPSSGDLAAYQALAWVVAGL
jgi:leucyl-tRNA synthetase